MIKDINKTVIEIIENGEIDELEEMSNYRKKDTGLPFNIWIQSKTGKEKHGPRIKVQNDYGDNFNIGHTVSITISDKPKLIGKLDGINMKDIKKILKFINKNKQLILSYWDGKVSSNELSSGMKKVE